MPNIFTDNAGRGLSNQYYKGDLRGAIAIAVERFLTERIATLICDYSRTLRLMDSMGAVKRDKPAIWKFPIDWQIRKSKPITENTYQGSFTDFEPGGGTGLRGIATLARNDNELAIAAFEVAQRKVETAIPWYTQDVTLSNSPMAREFISNIMQRLVRGQAIEVNEDVWNFNAACNGTIGGTDSTVSYQQSEQIYSIPFLVNSPVFVMVRGNETGNPATALKAMVADGTSLTGINTVFYSQNDQGAQKQEVGGLIRSKTDRRFWSVPHKHLHEANMPRRTNHVWSGLITTGITGTYANNAGAGLNTNSYVDTNSPSLAFRKVTFRYLAELYNNLRASNYRMPDVAITHPEFMAWMDDQVWVRRDFATAEMRAVFGNQVSFFLDTPIYDEVMVTPVEVPAVSGRTYPSGLAAGDKLYSMYFLTLRDTGVALMLNNSIRPIKQYEVPVPSDYFMGTYYLQLVLQDPVAQGFAVNLKPD